MKPIAIIGMGCRFPGANSPELFWDILSNGIDAITEVPQNRWSLEQFYSPKPNTTGKMSTRWGAFLENIDQFDPGFFNISPREAEKIDPQQRLLLEVSWEALENSGIVPQQLAGSNTGVFIGISNSDYGRLTTRHVSALDAYTGTGASFSIAANRISYSLDLKGPSLAIDTACSSSLVAIHLACQSLRTGESSLCLVGGVNLIISPEATITFSQAQMMAADGRCKTFDARADGYVRGEGCGIVVLKLLEEAIKDQDNILAVIRGSAVNQDGLTNGITAPNGPSQQKVIREALNNAAVRPEAISYIEAHGTGTPLGDPVEVRSLKAVLMNNHQPEQTCWLGSVKTNIGHLESAAGIASLIKVILALQHREISPHLHFQKLNPYISLEGTNLKIPTTCQTWETHNQQSRLAGISGFGFGGTNCHLIVQEYNAPVEEQAKPQGAVPTYFLLPLSAKTEESLKALARKYLDLLAANSEVSLADICFTASTKRSHFPYRLAVIADSKKQLQEKLAGFIQGDTVVGLVTGKAKLRKQPKVAFLFTGQGSQYVGMGKQLYDTQPTFRKTLDRCNAILNSYLDIDLLKVIHSDNPADSLINETAYTQPALFALEYALAQLWISWGIKPAVVMGHSVGEYVAATIAGVFSLEDGLKLIAARGRLMQALPDNGSMFAIMATESEAKEAIEGYESQVSIAAINGPQNVVISGHEDAINQVISRLEAKEIKTKQLKVSHAFHSPLVEPILTEFKKIAQEISYNKPKIKLISNITGKEATEEVTTPDYWCRHIRQEVRFADSMQTLQEQNYKIFLEVGSKPTLLSMGRHCVDDIKALWLPSLRPGYTDEEQLLDSLGQLYITGAEINWSALIGDYKPQLVTLPNYAFQRQRYWIENQNSQLQDVVHIAQKIDIKNLTKQLNNILNLSSNDLQLLALTLPALAEYQRQQELETRNSNTRAITDDDSTSNDVSDDKVISLNKSKSLKNQIITAPLQEGNKILESYFSQLLAKVMKINPDDLNWEQQLSALGMDSLIAVEIRKKIEQDLDINVPVEYFASLTIKEFLHQIASVINSEEKANNVVSTNKKNNCWLYEYKPSSQAKLRLFCFGYAGGGASLFQSWSDYLSPEVELCSIQLPGRENRYQEPAFTRLKPLIKELVTAIKPYLNCNYTFFGYSLGGLISFELIRELRRQNLPLPCHLFVGAMGAPQIPDLAMPIHNLSDEKFKKALDKLQGIPKIILDDKDFIKLYLPALKADFAILETYFYGSEKPLDIPITVFGGSEDKKVTSKEMEAWKKQTSNEFSYHTFPGDHFFLNTARKNLIEIILHQTRIYIS